MIIRDKVGQIRKTNKPQCQKRTLGHVRPAKTQISLRIRAESSLGAFWIGKDATFLHADNEDYDQTARMGRLI